MSWDDIEVMASDVVGGCMWEHPVQLVMSSERRVELPESSRSKYVNCPHRAMLAFLPGLHSELMPSVTCDYETVKLHPCAINNVPFKWATWRDMHGRFLVRHVTWVMGLCSCGTLYWRHVDEIFDVIKQ